VNKLSEILENLKEDKSKLIKLGVFFVVGLILLIFIKNIFIFLISVVVLAVVLKLIF